MRIRTIPFFFTDTHGTTWPKFLEVTPRFDRHGKRITNPFTYKVLEVLERALWEITDRSFFPHDVIEFRLSIEYDKDNGYWAQIESDRIE